MGDSKGEEVHTEGWTGRSLWNSGAMLAAHLWQEPRQGPLRVLELACGAAALPGLALALGGHHVTFADLAEVLPLARKNVQLNAEKWGVMDLESRTHFMTFNWHDEVPEDLCFDLIIGSDIVYGDDHIEHIRRWLRTLLGRNNGNVPVTEAIVSGENRKGTLERLLQRLGDDGIQVGALSVPEAFIGPRFERPHPYHRLELHRLSYGNCGAVMVDEVSGAVTGGQRTASGSRNGGGLPRR
jgi:predicted nicotinamide N-methyase